jgi:hypothetical protein
MYKGSKKETYRGQKVAKKQAKCLIIAHRGITTGHDFANFMSALMSDLISGAVAPMIGNAACNAGGKLLKIVELQMKHGTPNTAGQKVLNLALQGPLINNSQK